jgi:hypothetical protein
MIFKKIGNMENVEVICHYLLNYWKNAIDFLERKKEGPTQPDHQLR